MAYLSTAALPGMDAAHPDLRDPDPATNNTVLSGDIDGTPGTITGDAYHVVTAANITSVTELSGFTIRKGNARAAGWLWRRHCTSPAVPATSG